jgi:molybdopterin-containing oxidoreductase family iron-sulfur binding subunit
VTNVNQLDLDSIRTRLAATRGREYWQSLEELASSQGFAELLEREAPGHSQGVFDALDRRQFLRLAGASLALAGLGACTRQPAEKIVPYVKPPEGLVLGEPLYFATAMPLAGVATGLLVKSNEGRPTKVEGNPEHPGSLGATDPFCQAAILGLYDPDRSAVIRNVSEIRTWGIFLDALRGALDGLRPGRGAGLRILTETVGSPTLAGQIREILAAFPEARWHQFEPSGRDNVRAGARLAFGEPVETLYRFDRAEVILSLDADFLSSGAGHVRHLRDFSARRRQQGATIGRLYVAESMPSGTGAIADQRFPVRAGAIEDLARELARDLGVGVQARPGAAPRPTWLDAVVRDLRDRRGAGVVIAGESQPPAVHAMVHAINQALGNGGRTVLAMEPLDAEPVLQLDSLAELARDMEAGAVQMLVMIGGNPVYNAPADLRFADRLGKVPLRIHLGLYDDETSELCHWHVPEAHFLESWSDARAYDGTVTILQPLIAPLYGGKTAHELLALFSDRPDRSAYEIVRDYWRKERGAADGDFERFWRRALHDGVVPGTALRPKAVKLRTDWAQVAPLPTVRGAGGSSPGSTLEIAFRPDPTIDDGRFANNGWLQELPKPSSKLTWDNAAYLGVATAGRLGLANEDLVELSYRGRSVRAPVWIVPGHAEDSVTVHCGYGRRRSGRVGTGVGFDAYLLRHSDAPSFDSGLEIRPTGERHLLACTQRHFSLEGRAIVRAATREEYAKNPRFAHEHGEEPAPDDTLYRPFPYEGNQWGMAIDIGACVGCSACVVACVAENNIPVVGKDQVSRGREMHWLRIDRYYTGDADNPETYHQPMLCQHCENAPCEVVCPVNATNHSAEGLNQMVYNRCVGTRYCSNNCPYKVRRFNFYLYNDWHTESLKLGRNPDVTVRSRGVMEKCTYCVQRIEAARITARKEGRAIREGEIVTACQQACPAEAIVFGDINDPASRVAKLKAEPRNYSVLGELNTRPRTTYLAAVRNPNPAIARPGTGGSTEGTRS